MTFQRLGQFVKRPVLAQRKRVISGPISVMVDVHLQLKRAKRDKLEGNNDDGSR